MVFFNWERGRGFRGWCCFLFYPFSGSRNIVMDVYWKIWSLVGLNKDERTFV